MQKKSPLRLAGLITALVGAACAVGAFFLPFFSMYSNVRGSITPGAVTDFKSPLMELIRPTMKETLDITPFSLFKSVFKVLDGNADSDIKTSTVFCAVLLGVMMLFTVLYLLFAALRKPKGVIVSGIMTITFAFVIELTVAPFLRGEMLRPAVAVDTASNALYSYSYYTYGIGAYLYAGSAVLALAAGILLFAAKRSPKQAVNTVQPSPFPQSSPQMPYAAPVSFDPMTGQPLAPQYQQPVQQAEQPPQNALQAPYAAQMNFDPMTGLPIQQPAENLAAPVEAVAEAAENIAVPVEEAAEPVLDNIVASIETAAEPAEDLAAPVEAVSEVAENIAMPVEIAAEPVENIAVPVEAVAEVAENIAMPVEAVAEPAENIAVPVEAVAEPVENIAAPVEASAQFTQSTPPVQPTQPTQPTQMNFDPMTGQPLQNTPPQMNFDPMTGQPLHNTPPQMNFDPMTGQPLHNTPPQMNFDPMTGQPLQSAQYQQPTQFSEQYQASQNGGGQ